MTSQKRSRRRRRESVSFPAFPFILAILLIALGVAISVFSPPGIPDIWQQYKSAEWSKTEGVVLRSEVLDQGIDEIVHRFDIAVRYVVDGRKQTLREVFPGQRGGWSSSNVKAVRFSSRYEVGDNVTVYYDPNDPGMATLELGIQSGALFLIPFGMVPMLLGVWLFLYACLQLFRWLKQLYNQLFQRH